MSEQTAGHEHVRAAQMVQGSQAAGGGVVSLAVGQGVASHNASGESLIDIEIPIPGVPTSSGVAMQDHYVPQQTDPAPAVIGSFSDNSKAELQTSSRRSANLASRAPELIQRGQPMRIGSDAVRTPGLQASDLPSAAESSRQALEFSLSDTAATPVQNFEPSAGQPRSEEGPVVVSLDEHGNWDQEALMNQPGVLPQADDSVADNMAEQFAESQARFSEQETNHLEQPEGSMRMRMAVDAPQAGLDASMDLSVSADSMPTDYPNHAPAFMDDTPLQLSDMRVDPQPSNLVTGQAADESPLATPIDPSQLSMGDEMLVSREQPVLVKMDQPVLEYSVEHPGICRLIQTSETTLSLIGLQDGDTRIAVVTASGEQERNIEIRGVRVASASAPQGRLQTLAREVTQTIKRLYPYGDVQVVASGEELIVQGYVQAEKDARKIVSLVRKTSLSPVIDRLHSMSR